MAICVSSVSCSECASTEGTIAEASVLSAGKNVRRCIDISSKKFYGALPSEAVNAAELAGVCFVGYGCHACVGVD